MTDIDTFIDTYPEPSTEPGVVTWECTEEDGGPDVGICIGLGNGRLLHAGDITKSRHAEGGEDVAALGDHFGWWLILYGKSEDDCHVLGKFASPETARTFMDALEAGFRVETPEDRARRAGE